MKRLIAWALSLLLAVAPASAQMMATGIGGGGFGGSAAAYQGPGDITSGAIIFGSCYRAYTAAYASGTNPPLCDLVATSGGASVCTLRVLTTGKVDLAASYCAGTTPAAACAAASGGACRVSKVYDQTGTGNHLDVAPVAPLLTFNPSGLGAGTVAMTFAGAGEVLRTTGFVTRAQPLTAASISIRTGGTGSFTQMVGGNGNPPGLLYTNAANTISVYAGSIPTQTASDNSWHNIDGLFNAASSQGWVDGTGSGAISSGTDAFTGAFGISIGSLSGTSLTGSIAEVAIWAGDKSADIATLNSNAHSSANGYNF